MEIEILNLINQHLHGSDFFNHFFKIVTLLSEKGLIWLALGALFLIFKKTRKVGFITIIGVGATFFVNSLIFKNIFDRVRPFVENPELATYIKSIGMSLPDSFSFPSGHTFVSFCCAIIIGLGLKKKWWFIYFLAGAIALSRIFLCVHYPTDVIAGMILGTLAGIGIHFAMNYILKKLDEYILKRRLQKSANNQPEEIKDISDSDYKE